MASNLSRVLCIRPGMCHREERTRHGMEVGSRPDP